jgi:FlaA1/EpsC-like NDP-sugar epimerase
MIVLIQALIIPRHGIPVPFMIIAGLVVLASFIAVRYRLRLVTGLASRWIDLRNSGYGAGERVLVVGAGEGSAFAAWLLHHTDFRRLYTVVGIVDDDPAKQGMRYDGLKVLGTPADIPELVRRHDIDVIFYAIVKISSTDRERILAACARTGLRVIMLPELLRSLHIHLTLGKAGSEKNFPFWNEAEVRMAVPMENTNL